MRWKSIFLIIILSAILSNYNVQSSDDDIDQYVESVDDYDGEVKIEETEKSKVSSVETKLVESTPSQEPSLKPVVSIASNTTLRKASATGERSGKYLDYAYLSQLDLNDQNYDWNGE